MDNTQLKSIAVGALTGHWPVHLGLHTDAEKIEWLARQVEELADEAARADNLDEDLGKAEDRCDELQDDIADMRTCDGCKLCDDHKAQ